MFYFGEHLSAIRRTRGKLGKNELQEPLASPLYRSSQFGFCKLLALAKYEKEWASLPWSPVLAALIALTKLSEVISTAAAYCSVPVGPVV